MKKEKKFHDFYLCEIEPDEGSGYLVKQVNSEGRVFSVHPAPFDAIDWFENKDYVKVSREEWNKIGT